MALMPEKTVKMLNQIEFNILEKSMVKNPARAKELARKWLKLAQQK